MEKISILITDDNRLIRESWSFVLNADPNFTVLATASCGEEAVELARQFRPNIILMDINLPGINGIDIIPLIKKYSPGSKIIGVSIHSQPSYALKMLRTGAMGYVTKNSPREEMCKAITEVHHNRKYVCEEVKNILGRRALEEKPRGFNSLSQREITVIIYLKKGLSSKEIAATLDLSTKTIQVHRYNILKKLELKNTAELINFIYQSELAFD